MSTRPSALILALTVAISLIPSPASALSDVDRTRYGDAFAYLGAKGAVQGYSDGTGRPYSRINRAEALKVIVQMHERTRSRAQWYSSRTSSLPLFVDYRQGEWFVPYVEAGFEAGVLKGYPDRTFRAGNSITVEEALAMILRSYGENPQAGGEWFSGYVQYAADKNLVYRDERLYLGTAITRGQFFDILYRLDSIRQDRLTAFVDRVAPSNPAPNPVSRPTGPTAVSGVSSGDDRQYASSKYFAITIPSLGITDLTISHPSDALTSAGLLSVLKDGVGHLFSYPGRGGKIMVYGHSSSYAWDVSKFTKIFRKVNELKNGEKVYVTFDGKLYVYQVTGQQTISPNDVRPFQGRGEELILFTCWPVGTTKSRLLVHASPVTTVALR